MKPTEEQHLVWVLCCIPITKTHMAAKHSGFFSVGRQISSPWAITKFQMPHPRDLDVRKCRLLPEEGEWVLLEWTDALHCIMTSLWQVNNPLYFTELSN